MVETSAADPEHAAAWDGLPIVPAAPVVIRAARAAELAAAREPLQVA
jgi:hypothetical protein